jgi:hypothetical protein
MFIRVHLWLLLLTLSAASTTPWLPQYVDIGPQAGLNDVFPNGGPNAKQKSKKYIIETTGSGAALIDYDNDGFLDALVISGEGAPTRLYHNDGSNPIHFTDVTKQTALDQTGWGQGVCAGDYDNDGFTDFAITALGYTTLWHNDAGKHFTPHRLNTGRYNTGCAFLDYDRDGRLDLFIANYLRFDIGTVPLPGANPYCFYKNVPVNCGPRGLEFDRNQLFHNDGDGKFSDASETTGIARPNRSYSLSVLTGDFNNDGWPDIFVAADQTPSLLYINDGKGHFEEEALLRGTALDESGKALSGMGATAADYDGDGWLDIFRTNFSDEYETLYRNRGNGDFDDATQKAGLSINTQYVGWGCGFFDFDNDGWKDLLLVNGHVFPEVDQLEGPVRFRERSILYRNLGNGRFADISKDAGSAIMETNIARGAAFGDIDNDGTIEVLINRQNATPLLLRTKVKPPGHWLILKLEGAKSNRNAIGARVAVTTNGRTQIDEVRSGGSYLSQNDLRLHFGLGGAKQADKIEITWPSGARQTIPVSAGDHVVTVREP